MKLNGVVSAKIDLIADGTSKLGSLTDLSLKRLQSDYFLKRGIERTLQINIEAVIDIANRIISLQNHPPAPTSFRSLEILQDKGFIADASSYRKMIQFRNFIVHRYESINDEILLDILQNHLDDFYRFVQEIRDNDNY
ncbi:MAG: DUF86 domain-containing protein [Candidatus Marinimicrobia bacterium]|nr:DUF86 domain-containing protein [Candidatus Neomarinimicrobiota bacterium]